jgi:hypothetical protein
MKKLVFILIVIISVLSGCTKKEPTRTSGIDTIDNITYFSTTYYNYGFSFSGAKLVATTTTPGPDITIFVNVEDVTPRLTLQTNNLNPSFFKIDDYSATQWQYMADPLNANQVWIYKSGNNNYTKIRIVSTINETRQSVPYGECTFQWIYQPDGSTTFPGK